LDNIQTLITAFSNSNENFSNNLKQSEQQIQDLANTLKQIEDDVLSFKNDINSILKQIEQDVEANQGQLSKWVLSANTSLLKQQISQKRIELLDCNQKIIDSLKTLLGQLNQFSNDFRTTFLDSSINYKNLEYALASEIKVKQQTPNIQTQQASALMASDESVNNIINMLQKAVEALNSAQQGISQSKIYDELSKSIDSVTQ